MATRKCGDAYCFPIVVKPFIHHVPRDNGMKERKQERACIIPTAVDETIPPSPSDRTVTAIT